MRRRTRLFFAALPAVLLIALASFGACADEYPSRAVKVITGTDPGGLPDVFARLLAQKMSEGWGQVIVENRPGAAYKIAAELVAKSPPDGYTLLFGGSAVWALNPHLFASLPYEPMKFAPVIQLAHLPLFLVVPSSFPVTNVAQLIAHAKQHPGKLMYASSGIGSYHHIATEMFRSMAGIELVHVPYKGAAQAGAAVMTNQIQMGFLSYAAVQQGVKSGQVRVLAIATGRRASAFPDIPTIAEAGVAGYDIVQSVGIVAPPGTPRGVVVKLHAAIAAAASAPDVRQRIASFGATVTTSSPEQFGEAMRAEYAMFAPLIKGTGARND